MRSRVSYRYDVTPLPKGMNFCKLGIGFRLRNKPFSSAKKCKLNNCILFQRQETTYDIYPKEVIRRAKFDLCMPSSFERVETDRQTESRFIGLTRGWQSLT